MIARNVAGLLAVIGSTSATKVTPVEKVVELLKRLEKKIEGEGADEAKAYDKYACFCKEQADQKLYQIETSTAKIAKMQAKIDKLAAEITDLDTDIGNLDTEITSLEGTINTNQQTRDGEHAVFLTNQADAASAIDAVYRAIKALEDSKKALGGKAKREAAFSQVKALALVALSSTSRAALSDHQVAQLNYFVKNDQEPAAYSYEYSSNDIIATLDDLLKTFTRRKLQLEDDEFKANAAHELKQQSLQNEKKFAEKEKAEKEALREDKTEEKEATEADKTQESADKTADKNFLDVLTADCQTKANLWDQRSQTRASELTAIADAMRSLKSGVAPNYKANKKLVGLQEHSSSHGHWVFVEDHAPVALQIATRPASFVQVRSRNLRGASQAQVMSRVRDLLASSAQSLRSPVLSVAALKVGAAEDHFVKVRQIIRDLIDRLEADATSEATLKSWCDEETRNAVTKRDSKQSDIEKFNAEISGKEAEKAQLKRDIAKLSTEIAELKKALLEAETLREEERKENEKTVDDAGAGKDAVQFALNTLKEFYENQGAFLQFVPTNSDREGKTVGDRAPEVFDSEYHGSQEASKGIIGLLEVILADFDRTTNSVNLAEAQAVSDFNAFKTTNEQNTQTKETSVSTKEGEIDTIDSDLVTLQDNLKTAKEGHADAEKELSQLHSRCVKGEETYQERVGNREKEIESLKEAHDILENWNK